MLNPVKLLFSAVLFFLFLVIPSQEQLFSFPQSSILMVYFVYMYLSYASYANLTTMTISKYDTKGDLYFDFMLKQGIFIFCYLLIITIAGLAVLPFKESVSATVLDVIVFFVVNYINLVLIGCILLFLRIFYGTVAAFVTVGLYVGISSFSSLFLGFMFTQSSVNLPNPFVIATAYGEPVGIATVIGYLFLLLVLVGLGVFIKKKDMKV